MKYFKIKKIKEKNTQFKTEEARKSGLNYERERSRKQERNKEGGENNRKVRHPHPHTTLYTAHIKFLYNYF